MCAVDSVWLSARVQSGQREFDLVVGRGSFADWEGRAAVHREPVKLVEVADVAGTAFTLGPTGLEAGDPLRKLGSFPIQRAKDAKGPDVLERIQKRHDIRWLPRCELVAFHDVFGDFVQVAAVPDVHHFYDVAEAVG